MASLISISIIVCLYDYHVVTCTSFGPVANGTTKSGDSFWKKYVVLL